MVIDDVEFERANEVEFTTAFIVVLPTLIVLIKPLLSVIIVELLVSVPGVELKTYPNFAPAIRVTAPPFGLPINNESDVVLPE